MVAALSPFTIVVSFLSLVGGFVTAEVNNTATPKKWLSALTVAAAFLAAGSGSLVQCGSLASACVWAALAAGGFALLNALGGFAAHAHFRAGTQRPGRAALVTPAETSDAKRRSQRPPTAARVRGVAPVLAAAVLLAAPCSGCLADAPIVPITPANQAQVTTCENTAALHNGFVIGDFTLTGAGGALGAVGALEPGSQAKTGLAIGATIAGAGAILASSVVALSSSNFANNHCSDVVGPLPANPPASSQQPGGAQ
jgi:hypothetical protein